MTDASFSWSRSVHRVVHRLEAESALLERYWCVSPEVGRLLHLLGRISGARNILEIGTSIGYSGLWLGLAAAENSGGLTTVEASEDRLAIAEEHFRQAGLAEIVRGVHGDALTCLDAMLAEGTRFDYVFVDARKDEYLEYFRRIDELVRPGSLLVADNTRSHREKMLPFLEVIADHPDWRVADLETPSGLLVAWREYCRTMPMLEKPLL